MGFSSDVNPLEATVDHPLANEGGQKLLNTDCNLVILGGWRQHAAVSILSETSRHPWTSGHVHMHLIMPRDGASMKQTEAVKLSKTCDTSSALVCLFSMFVDNMKCWSSILQHLT